jgi:hypothetical protein
MKWEWDMWDVGSSRKGSDGCGGCDGGGKVLEYRAGSRNSEH